MFQENNDDNGLLYYYVSRNWKPSNKVIFMDLDHTLIVPKSGKKHPIDLKDWKFNLALDILQSYIAVDWSIVILTNQKKMLKQDIEIKMIDIIQQLDKLGIPTIFMVANQNDYYRKPSTGMIDFFNTTLNKPISRLDKFATFMVGDAAGRKGDHSAADIMLAENFGIHFMTPEIFTADFSTPPPPSGKIIATHEMKKLVDLLNSNPIYFNPQAYICNLTEKQIQTYKKEMNSLEAAIRKADKFMLIMVGPPASTKSTVASGLVSRVAKDAIIMSYDTFKGTKPAFRKEMANLVLNDKNIIIDNTHAKRKDRKPWFEPEPIAESYTKLIAFFDLPKPLVMHLNDLRNKDIVSGRNPDHEPIPDVAIHTWYKYLEPPSIGEDGSDAIFKFTSIDVEIIKTNRHFLEWNC